MECRPCDEPSGPSGYESLSVVTASSRTGGRASGAASPSVAPDGYRGVALDDDRHGDEDQQGVTGAIGVPSVEPAGEAPVVSFPLFNSGTLQDIIRRELESAEEIIRDDGKFDKAIEPEQSGFWKNSRVEEINRVMEVESDDGPSANVPMHNNKIKWESEESDEILREAVEIIGDQNGMDNDQRDAALARLGLSIRQRSNVINTLCYGEDSAIQPPRGRSVFERQWTVVPSTTSSTQRTSPKEWSRPAPWVMNATLVRITPRSNGTERHSPTASMPAAPSG